MAKDDKKPVFDVSKPGSTPPSASAKPVIVSQRPMVKDPTVNEEKSEDPQVVQREKPEIHPESNQGKTIQPEKSDDKPEPEKKEPEESASTDSSDESAVVDAVVSQNNDKKKKDQDTEDQARHEADQKLIDSKKYFVKVKAPKAKRNKRTLLIVLLVIFLGLVGIAAAADAELISINVPFDFIKKTEPKVSVIVPAVVEKETVATKKEDAYVVPSGYSLYENKDLGFKFTYPKELGVFSPVSTYGEGSDEAKTFDSYFVSKIPDTQILPGVNGPIAIISYKTADQTINPDKYSPKVKIKDNKLVITELSEVDEINKVVGAEYKTSEGKTISPTQEGNLKVFVLSGGDEGCISNTIIFIAKNKLHKLALPEFCDNSYGSDTGKPAIDPAKYEDLISKVLNSLRDVN